METKGNGQSFQVSTCMPLRTPLCPGAIPILGRQIGTGQNHDLHQLRWHQNSNRSNTRGSFLNFLRNPLRTFRIFQNRTKNSNSSRLSKCLEPSKSLQNTAMRLRCKAQIAKNLQTARTLRSLWSRKGHPFQKLPNFPVLPETFGTLPQKLSNYRTLAAKLTLFVEVQRTFWCFEDFFEALHHCKIRMKRFLGNFR